MVEGQTLLPRSRAMTIFEKRHGPVPISKQQKQQQSTVHRQQAAHRVFLSFYFYAVLPGLLGRVTAKPLRGTRSASGSGTGLEFAILGAAPAPPRQP